jgi:hypothetical protein
VATICVRRGRDTLARRRAMLIEVGDGPALRWPARQAIAVQADAGTHQLTARMDWATSRVLQLDLADDSYVELEARLPFSFVWQVAMHGPPKEGGSEIRLTVLKVSGDAQIRPASPRLARTRRLRASRLKDYSGHWIAGCVG